MRLTTVLCHQHIGWHFKKHWKYQGRRVIKDTGAAKVLKEKNICVYDPKDILGPQDVQLITEVPNYIPQPVKLDKTHPDWHDRICYTYRDDNVLLEGLKQAKIITKTVELQEGLPEKIAQATAAQNTSHLDQKVKKAILNSHVFDAEQQKLPKRKDPERPAWNFPRDYGITDHRVNKLIITKLLHIIEMFGDPGIVKQRSTMHNMQFCCPFEKAGNLLQLQLKSDTMVTASKPLSPITAEPTEELELPDIFPIQHTITLNTENIYKMHNIYPVSKIIPRFHPHTVFIHYNPTEVKNIYEEEITEEQVLGRSLMKTFAVAASYAKETFGGDVRILPKPVTVQCVHTDGRLFHFGVLQLNTLDLEEGGMKNVWYHMERMPLFASCMYNLGKPKLESYNNSVIKHLIAFYNNV